MKKITLLTAAISFAVVMAFLKRRSRRKAGIPVNEIMGHTDTRLRRLPGPVYPVSSALRWAQS
jgi:hypothetical protein